MVPFTGSALYLRGVNSSDLAVFLLILGQFNFVEGAQIVNPVAVTACIIGASHLLYY